MNKQHKSAKKNDVKAAMAVLEQAYEYYSPHPLPAKGAPFYDDMPFAR